jgi:hypothetical protein
MEKDTVKKIIEGIIETTEYNAAFDRPILSAQMSYSLDNLFESAYACKSYKVDIKLI